MLVLWAVTHDAFVLRSEHGLDRHVERSPEAWDRIREGVAEGRIDDVPLPVESFAAWCPGPGLDADALSGCIRSCEMATLAEFLATVEAVWSGEGEPDSLPPTALALVLEICRMRRIRIERDYEPVRGTAQYPLRAAGRPAPRGARAARTLCADSMVSSHGTARSIPMSGCALPWTSRPNPNRVASTTRRVSISRT